MGAVMILLVALFVLALVMYWIFSATARHAERRVDMLAQPARRPRRAARPTPDR
jgi:hypothetical protein